ncbi:MAG: dihydrodipicolinate synthase family protein [Verrucomicrobiota bacterium]
MKLQKIHGLVAATHTPFTKDGALNIAVIEKQAAHLLAQEVETAFIGGTTGEWSSLTYEERLTLAQRWIEVARGSRLKVIVHVGANSLAESRGLAQQAQKLGALAISAVAPSYFKPANIPLLVESMAHVASAAPELPFFYYEIPSLTGIALSPSVFLDQASKRIPNLAGAKFTSNNLIEYQLCRSVNGGTLDIPFGIDEMLLAALAMGATGAVGSTYNFSATIYHRVIKAFGDGNFKEARAEQLRSVQMVAVLAGKGYMGAAKAVMKMLGVDVGPARLPQGNLTPEQEAALRSELDALGFFDWIR